LSPSYFCNHVILVLNLEIKCWLLIAYIDYHKSRFYLTLFWCTKLTLIGNFYFTSLWRLWVWIFNVPLISISSYMLKLKWFSFCFILFLQVLEEILLSEVWCKFFCLLVVVTELTPMSSLCGKSTNSWCFEDPTRISNPTWPSGCNYMNRWVLVWCEN